MREIKFRAKRLDNNEWVYGNCIIDNWGDENNNIIYGILEDRKAPSFIENWIPVKVNNNTLGQFTGLKDKNDKEIYEGDVVRIFAYNFDEEEFFVVKYNNDTARYELVSDDLCVSFDNVYNYEVEIIGNIYDNPELLEANNED